MSDNTWAAKVLEGVPRFQTMSGNMLPYADALAAIAKLADFIAFTRQWVPEAADRIEALTATVAELQKATKSAEAVADNHWETLRSIRDIAKSSGDLARIVQWVDDAGAGYNETAEATLAAEMDRRIAAEAEAVALRERVARMEGALNAIDALDPEGRIGDCSVNAISGLVLLMGEIARAALTDGAADE